MKPKSCREKGRKFEFWVRKLISTVLNIPLDNVLIRSKSAAGVDVWVSNTYREVFPFGVECKNRNKLSFWKTVSQAINNAVKEKLIPLIIAKRGREVWVSMPAEVFFAILLNKKLSDKELERLKKSFPKFTDAKFSE